MTAAAATTLTQIELHLGATVSIRGITTPWSRYRLRKAVIPSRCCREDGQAAIGGRVPERSTFYTNDVGLLPRAAAPRWDDRYPGEEGADPSGGKVVRRVNLGILHRNDRFRHLYWQNFLSVDPDPELTADVLIAELDRLFAGLPIRHASVADAETAARLRPGFYERG